MSELVADLTEDQLIARFAPLLPQADALVPTGDDAAVIALVDPRVTVTTDALVEGSHFRRDWSTGYDVGWRAIMQNAPDVAAMGAVPVGFVVSLVLPGNLEAAWVVDLARGMADACSAITAQTGRSCGVVGGDLAAGDMIVVAVTAFGDLEARSPVLRSGAQVGAIVAHVGTLGRSAAGLALLDAGRHSGESANLASALETFRRPMPPLSAALAGSVHAQAMMDVSDGLVRDAGRIARASGVRIDLDPIEPDAVVAAVAEELGTSAEKWVMAGGEDHGFLAVFAPDVPLPPGFEPIGRVLAGAGLTVAGQPPTAQGWDHFVAKPRR